MNPKGFGRSGCSLTEGLIKHYAMKAYRRVDA
jgi:hypothetical protein